MRKIEHWDSEDEGTWAVSYGDMITLLLSFFVIFFSFDFKEVKEEKLEKEALQSMNQLSIIKSEISTPSKSIAKDVAVNTDGIFSDNDYIIEKVSPGQFVVIFKNTSFFSSGSLNIQKEAQEKLTKFAQVYLPFSGKYRVKVKAFTDRVPVRNRLKANRRFSDNLELSTLRSLNVMKYLSKKGVPMRRIEISGTGVISKNFEKYLGINKDVNRKALSRTVALVIKRDEDQG